MKLIMERTNTLGCLSPYLQNTLRLDLVLLILLHKQLYFHAVSRIILSIRMSDMGI